MKTLFQDQFRYNQWANERLLAFIDENDLKSNKINPIFSHLTLAQVIWCDRLNHKPTPIKINEWATWPWEEIDDKCRRTNQLFIDFINHYDSKNYEEIIEFVNTSGTPDARSVRHILMQIIHYTTFHRGQIVVLIHQDENRITPSLDFIDFINS